jgi:hypothetical protein
MATARRLHEQILTGLLLQTLIWIRFVVGCRLVVGDRSPPTHFLSYSAVYIHIQVEFCCLLLLLLIPDCCYCLDCCCIIRAFHQGSSFLHQLSRLTSITMADAEDAAFPQFHSAEAQSIYISALSQLESGRPDAIIPDIVPLSVAEAIAMRIGVAVGKVLHLKHHPHASSFEIKAENLDELRSAKPKKKDKIPRPSNAFILYRQHHHNAVKAKNHGITNSDLCKLHPLPMSQFCLTST